MTEALSQSRTASRAEESPGEILAPPSAIEKQEADRVRTDIENLLDRIAKRDIASETDFAALSARLGLVQSKQYWIDWGFKSFGRYIVSIERRVNRGRTQLYHCAGIGADVLPKLLEKGFTEKDLEEIGISKAAVLRTMVKDGKTPSPELIELAKTCTQEQLEAEIAESTGLRMYQEKGTWFSFGGAFYSAEEKAEFLRAANVAAKTDPVIGHTIENWHDVSPVVKKEIIWRWCATYLAEKEQAVEQGEG